MLRINTMHHLINFYECTPKGKKTRCKELTKDFLVDLHNNKVLTKY